MGMTPISGILKPCCAPELPRGWFNAGSQAPSQPYRVGCRGRPRHLHFNQLPMILMSVVPSNTPGANALPPSYNSGAQLPASLGKAASPSEMERPGEYCVGHVLFCGINAILNNQITQLRVQCIELHLLPPLGPSYILRSKSNHSNFPGQFLKEI